jgi:hypothetical protein
MHCLFFCEGKGCDYGAKFDTLEKHATKAKAIHNMAHLGKKKGEFYIKKKCNHA